MPSPYDLLDIDADADEEAVRAAYRDRVKETHPDQGGSAEQFQAVTAAYTAIIAGEADTQADWPTESAHPDEWSVDATVEYLNYAVIEDMDWDIDDPAIFERARELDLDDTDHGRLRVPPSDSLLEAAEREGFAWPFACRGGACANCAVQVHEGDLTQPPNHVLPEWMTERGVRLSCNGHPVHQDMKVIYNVKHRPELDELRLPPYPFLHAHSSD